MTSSAYCDLSDNAITVKAATKATHVSGQLSAIIHGKTSGIAASPTTTANKPNKTWVYKPEVTMADWILESISLSQYYRCTELLRPQIITKLSNADSVKISSNAPKALGDSAAAIIEKQEKNESLPVDQHRRR